MIVKGGDMLKSSLLIFALLFTLFGCEVNENEANVIKSNSSVASEIYTDPLLGSLCSFPPLPDYSDLELGIICEEQIGCQKVLNEENKYLGCVPNPDPILEDDIVTSDPISEPESNPDLISPEDDNSTDGYKKRRRGRPTEGECACSNPDNDENHKVLICHYNPAEDKNVTLCIAKDAWLNGHQESNHHAGEDYLGTCEI
tara:strand:- start:191 stop:790 length:600 start_codon:yes stop_codon:yes gene_type:complete